MQLTLNISPCPNDTFAFEAMLNGRIDSKGYGFSASFMDIEELNRTVIERSPDLSKISYAVYPLIRERYRILESGSALGRGNGQLLVRRAGDTHPIRKVVAPGLHTTATALLRRYFPDVEQIEQVYFADIAPAVAEGRADAGVLIHEGRFVYRSFGLELVADLGQMWERETSLPLPLGAIVARRDLRDEVISDVEDMLSQSIRYAMDHPAVSRPFVRRHAQELDDGVIDSHISLFVNDYTISLGEEGHRAVDCLISALDRDH